MKKDDLIILKEQLENYLQKECDDYWSIHIENDTLIGKYAGVWRFTIEDNEGDFYIQTDSIPMTVIKDMYDLLEKTASKLNKNTNDLDDFIYGNLVIIITNEEDYVTFIKALEQNGYYNNSGFLANVDDYDYLYPYFYIEDVYNQFMNASVSYESIKRNILKKKCYIKMFQR